MSIRKFRGPAAVILGLALMVSPAIANADVPTDTTAPTITLKPETVLSNGRATSASYKLYDASKVDKVVVNGAVKDLSNSTWSDLNGVKPGTFGAVEGSNTITVFDVAGNTTTVTLTLDTTGPTITVKPESQGVDGRYRSVSFKLNDGALVDKVVLNGALKDLSNNVWSDVNGVKPGVFGAVEGSNTLVAFDALGNSSTLAFVLDTTGPTITVKPAPDTNGSDGLYSKASFKLNDGSKVDKVTINGVLKDLTNNTWSDVNNVKPGQFGAVEGANVLVAFDALGNSSELSFVLDTKGPIIAVKDESVANGAGYSSISFKLNDSPAKVDKVVLNGVESNLTNNVWSDLNSVKPGKYGAVEGSNTLVAFDTLGNCTTFEFVLDTTVVEPETPVVTEPEPEEPVTEPEPQPEPPAEEETDPVTTPEEPKQENPVEEDTNVTTPVAKEPTQEQKIVPAASLVSNPVVKAPAKTIAPLEQLAATGPANPVAITAYAGALLLAGIALIVASRLRARVKA